MAVVCRQTNEKERTTRSDNGKNNKNSKLFLVVIIADNAHTYTQTGTNTENNEPISLIIVIRPWQGHLMGNDYFSQTSKIKTVVS